MDTPEILDTLQKILGLCKQDNIEKVEIGVAIYNLQSQIEDEWLSETDKEDLKGND